MNSDTNNRELSWLHFNERVLQEARDPGVPLMQRLRFLGIFSNNQDEFFKVRIANLERMARLRRKKPLRLSGGYSPAQLLAKVNERLEEVRGRFEQSYAEVLEQLDGQGIRIVDEKGLDERQRAFCREYFASVVSPRLVPLILRKRVPLPFLSDRELYLAVRMEQGSKRSTRYAVLEIPVSEACPRFVVLPSTQGRTEVILLDDILRLMLDEIFFMFRYRTITAHTFRLLRDAELTLDDDVSKSLTEKMTQGLDQRQHGRPVRLIYDREMPGDLLETIAGKLHLRSAGVLSAGGRYHQMSHLMRFPRIRPDLENRNPAPLRHPDLPPFTSLLRAVRRRDILLNFPYHTFQHVLDLLREAAVDPRVEAISITLYRTADHSKVVGALKNAARNGKRVTAVVELKARFDEERNITITDELQRDGIRVVHSAETLKVHAKLILIERRESKAGTRGYVYVGTGNFNESTAAIYSDLALLTVQETIVADVRRLFASLDESFRYPRFKQLIVSPMTMRATVEELIDNEIRNARRGKPAYIHAKCNSLTDARIIERLYRASAAGVQVRLIVRGACCLRPGVEGLSERIEARSIVDKYLEHARLMLFCNAGDERAYISSADWMTRNLDRRIEAGVPILDKRLRGSLRRIFEVQWSDNTKARDLADPAALRYVERGEGEPVRSQTALYEFYRSQQK